MVQPSTRPIKYSELPRDAKPARNQFLWDLIRVADPRLTASSSQLSFAELRKKSAFA